MHPGEKPETASDIKTLEGSRYLEGDLIMIATEILMPLTIILLLLGIAGSIIPGIPGVLASVAGVLLYWWGTGFTEPGKLFLVITAVLGLTGLLVDWFSSAITAKAGGASNKTSVAAGIAGFFGFFLLGGPIGVIAASAGVVFAREYMRTGDIKKSRKAGIYSALGILASTFMQVMITGTILIGFIIAVIF